MMIAGTMILLAACAHEPRIAPTKDGDIIGTATMDESRRVSLTLGSVGCDGTIAHGFMIYRVGDPDYARTIEHIGGLEPGQSKPVPAWPTKPCSKNKP